MSSSASSPVVFMRLHVVSIGQVKIFEDAVYNAR